MHYYTYALPSFKPGTEFYNSRMKFQKGGQTISLIVFLILQNLIIQKLVSFLYLSNVVSLNLNLSTIVIWDQFIFDCGKLFYAISMFSFDLHMLDTDSTPHSPALSQPKHVSRLRLVFPRKRTHPRLENHYSEG